MKAIMPNFQSNSSAPLYLQLYHYIKSAILEGSILPLEKLPSLRSLSKSLGLSLTTIELAYNQLLVEGYIYSKPQSGYYVNQISAGMGSVRKDEDGGRRETVSPGQAGPLSDFEKIGYFDMSCFDFIKWKKCVNQVLTEYPHLLLRKEIPKERKRCGRKSQNMSTSHAA